MVIADRQATSENLAQVLKQEQPVIADLCDVFKDIGQYEDSEKLALLKKALQAAVSLEFATIPPYLCAIWSIKDDLHPVARSIREVLQEEMLHLAFACNMLVAIGDRPILNDPPMFPTGLPGGVHPNLTVHLSGLNNKALHDFMEIELPEKVITIDGDDFDCEHNDYDTIGAMYDGIARAFELLDPPVDPSRQLSGPLSWFVLVDIKSVQQAIHLIKRQGEGATNIEDSGPDDLAHFYRFWEILKGKNIIKDPETETYHWGKDIETAELWPVSPIPAGGYREEQVAPEVWELLLKFDQTYTQLVDLLHGAWGHEGGQAELVKAVEVMFSLEKYAKPLMQIPIPGASGNYGPCFRIVREREEMEE